MFGDEEEIIRKPALRRYGVPALLVAFIGGGAFGIMRLMKHSGPALDVASPLAPAPERF